MRGSVAARWCTYCISALERQSARKIGRFFNTFLRVDFYASVNGCVFGEIQFVVNEMDYSHRLDDKVQKAFLDNIHQFQK